MTSAKAMCFYIIGNSTSMLICQYRVYVWKAICMYMFEMHCIYMYCIETVYCIETEKEVTIAGVCIVWITHGSCGMSDYSLLQELNDTIIYNGHY